MIKYHCTRTVFMKSVYILLINSNTIFSRIIKTLSKDKYTHASISFSDDLFPFYSFGRKFTYMFAPAGLKKEPFDKGFFKHNKNIPCTLLKVEAEDENFELAKQYVDKLFTDNKRHGFNLLGLCALKFGITIKRKNRMFCSEFVANALNNGNIVKYENPSSVHPIDFLKIKNAKCIYEGKLKDIPQKIYT